jgi:hypothetical protein
MNDYLFTAILRVPLLFASMLHCNRCGCVYAHILALLSQLHSCNRVCKLIKCANNLYIYVIMNAFFVLIRKSCQ